MAKQFEQLTPILTKFIEAQHIFFCGSAGVSGRVNVSPKGMDSLRILAPDRIVWRNLTGSGNETAGHLAQINRLTLMWCGFEAKPMILRVFGTARTLHKRDVDFDTLNALFEPSIGARQIYDVKVDMVQTSCGYAVPYMDYKGERDALNAWAQDKGESGLANFWVTKNQSTIDGFPTNLLVPEDT